MEARWNFTLDICNRLQRDKGVEKQNWCHDGARVCGVRSFHDVYDVKNDTIQAIDIAGTYTTQGGRNMVLDPTFKLLRDSESNSDASREGVRVELHGGRYPFESKTKGIDQRAIIEFVCDLEREGDEGAEKDTNERAEEPKKDEGTDKGNDGDKKEEKKLSRRDGEKGKCEDSDASLRFCGYEDEKAEKDKQVKTLRLEWRTKYACENAPAPDGGKGWGFFTWFIIILFLATAAYLIFGSWLNYNRYGARGWDLLPHGDTIRDIPYIVKDLGRKVVNAVQSPGSRGGYSAV
ncbi:type II membrane protein [Didymosphaeria variabile]|uniref:Type II membrane protein n=1 Tax=Didymosphaeria variabile TaxID=1932322 RepID=A0A9W8XVL2_9PLEO|nr:type II membrane protein [Didymosphaeria variabile]KAJ4360091.1 type II membrane protein [Didymosphaeria variabile]